MNTQATLNQLAGLSERKLAADKLFIDRVVTVASGALALSATFRSTIAGEGARHLWLLQGAWIGLAVAALGGVYLHRIESSTCRRLIIAIQQDEVAPAAGPHPVFEPLWVVVQLGFALGLLALAAFAIVNVD